MASFDFNYAIILKDKFSAVSGTIRKHLDKMDASIKKSSRHTEDYGRRLEVLARKLVLPTVGLMLILREGLKSADKQIVAQKVLAQTLGIHNKFLVAINEQSEKLEKTTRFSQESFEQIATSMAQFSHSGYVAKKSMLPIANMASAIGMSLQQAGLLFAKAVTSPTNALDRYDIVIKKGLHGMAKFNAVFNAVQAKWGGVAFKMGKVGLGPLIEAGLQIAAVWRDVGKAVMPTLQEFGKWLKPLMIKLDHFVNTHKILVKWLAISLISFTALATVVAGLAMFIGALSLVFGLLDGSIAVFGAAITIAMGPVGVIIVAIGALIALGYYLYRRFKLVRDIFKLVGAWLKSLIYGFKEFEKIVVKIVKFLDKLFQIGKFFSMIGHGIKAVGHFLEIPHPKSKIPSDIARPIIAGTHHTVNVALTVHDPSSIISKTHVSTETRLTPSPSGINMKSVLGEYGLQGY